MLPGTLNLISPHGCVDFGNSSWFAIFTAAGLNRAGSMRLPANGAESVTCRPALHSGRRGRGEVARQHGGGGHERQVVRRRLDGPRALVGAEEEEPVPHDRPAQRPAELVPVETVVQPLAVRSHRGERGLGVEAAVAEELERVAVEAVGAGLHTALTDADECIPLSADRPLVATRNSCSASGKGNGRLELS